MGKHFTCKIDAGSFAWSRRAESIQQEEKLDGVYVLRTSEPAERLSTEDTVRSYKSLAEVERAFRCLKGIDLLVRPIRHRTEDRVPAHIFLCVLAHYVEWHLRRAWAPLLFEDEERWEERKHRDPVLPAQPSASAKRKKSSHQTADGLPVYSFEDLLKELASRARVTYALKPQKAEEKTNLTFRQVPEPTAVQARAYELLRTFPVTAR
jgi:Transposase DDE domain